MYIIYKNSDCLSQTKLIGVLLSTVCEPNNLDVTAIIEIQTKNQWAWSGYITITHCRPTHGTMRKSNRTMAKTKHQEDKQSKSNQLYLPHQDDYKTRKGTTQCKKHGTKTQNPTNETTINNETTTTKPPPYTGLHSKPPGMEGRGA